MTFNLLKYIVVIVIHTVGDEIHLYVVPATNLLILLQDRSQKSQVISIRRSLIEVRTLRGHES